MMDSLGLGTGNQAVVNAYGGLISDLVVDTADAEERLTDIESVHATDTRIGEAGAARRFSEWLLELL